MPLTQIPLSELSKPLRRTYDRAREAMEKKNYPYATEMLRNLLLKAPGCTEARETLRRVQLERIKGKPTFLLRLKAYPAVILGAYIKGPMLLKKGETAKALDAAEGLMTLDPTFLPSILFLARAAEEGGLYDLALSTLQHGIQYYNDNIELLQRQLAIYRSIEDEQNALRILQEMCKLRPNDLKLNNEMKQTSASAAMERGKWNDAQSFRDIVKDKDEAQRMEDEERLSAHDEEALERRIRAAEVAAKEKANSGTLKKLGDLYRQNGQFDEALETYNRIVEIAGAMDPTIDQAITDVLVEKYDRRIEAARAEQDEQRATELEHEKEETLFQRAQERVKRYPNDAQYRYELGGFLYDRDRFNEAMKQFQAAQRNPRFRRPAQMAVGKCMAAKGMLEMAVEQLETALSESTEMDAGRKEILYNLALVQEAQENTDAYIARLKEIYAADANYEDVEPRIQAYYQQQKTKD